MKPHFFFEFVDFSYFEWGKRRILDKKKTNWMKKTTDFQSTIHINLIEKESKVRSIGKESIEISLVNIVLYTVNRIQYTSIFSQNWTYVLNIS